MYTVESQGGENLAGGNRPHGKAKLAARGKGQGALGQLFTGRQTEPAQGSSSDHHL